MVDLALDVFKELAFTKIVILNPVVGTLKRVVSAKVVTFELFVKTLEGVVCVKTSKRIISSKGGFFVLFVKTFKGVVSAKVIVIM